MNNENPDNIDDKQWLGIWIFTAGISITVASVAILWGWLTGALVLGPLLITIGAGMTGGKP